jgi:LysR family transcriptional regulator, hypochlorite-specific transcription factor HypT
VDLKLIEDLAALAQHQSFTRAAQARHITHPAFGRRIRALEAWAGVPLIDRSAPAPVLTAEGRALLEDAQPLVATLTRQRARWQAQARGGVTAPMRVGTGRTLARTLVADWLARHQSRLKGQRLELITRSMAEVAALFEQGEVDLLCCYEHPALSIKLSAQRFAFLTLAQDRLVPVARCDATGRVRHRLDDAAWIAYAPSLSLGRLLADHISRRPLQLPPASWVCDSADVMLQLALKGVGVAWLPWSLAASDCKRGLLKPLGGRADEAHFEVRLYRPRARQSETIEKLWAATA